MEKTFAKFSVIAFGVILSVAISVLGWNVFLWKAGAIMVQHEYIYNKLDQFTKINHTVPKDLSYIEDTSRILPKIMVSYDPAAYGKNRKVLLKTPLLFWKIVTFGNRDHARLWRWSEVS